MGALTLKTTTADQTITTFISSFMKKNDILGVSIGVKMLPGTLAAPIRAPGSESLLCFPPGFLPTQQVMAGALGCWVHMADVGGALNGRRWPGPTPGLVQAFGRWMANFYFCLKQME